MKLLIYLVKLYFIVVTAYVVNLHFPQVTGIELADRLIFNIIFVVLPGIVLLDTADARASAVHD